ncbi:MAG: CoA transferase [Chloroflexota bacterium]
MTQGALTGLKVIEFGEFISGPYCGKLLADLGAEVVKIEKPGLGDKSRDWGPFPQDIPHPEKSGLFLYLNTNKLGATLNVGTAAGTKIFKELMKWADILVENNPPREMVKLGLDWERLHYHNSSLVMTSITPFGQTGPYHDYKACDLISLNMSGEAYINPMGGVDDIERQAPLTVPGHACYFLAGLTGAVGTASAILAQRINGTGRHVDVSEQEAALYAAPRQELVRFTCGEPLSKRTRQAGGAGSNMFATRDGHIILLGFTEDFWRAQVEMMGNPEWASSDLFKDMAARRQNGSKLAVLISDWMKQHTTNEVVEAARGKRIPMAVVQTVKEAIESNLLREREYFVEVEREAVGTLTYPGAPYKLSATPWNIRRPAPLLGEHNEEVYCRILGYSRTDLVRMRQAGII